jgi:hypothetical protein
MTLTHPAPAGHVRRLPPVQHTVSHAKTIARCRDEIINRRASAFPKHPGVRSGPATVKCWPFFFLSATLPGGSTVTSVCPRETAFSRCPLFASPLSGGLTALPPADHSHCTRKGNELVLSACFLREGAAFIIRPAIVHCVVRSLFSFSNQLPGRVDGGIPRLP